MVAAARQRRCAAAIALVCGLALALLVFATRRAALKLAPPRRCEIPAVSSVQLARVVADAGWADEFAGVTGVPRRMEVRDGGNLPPEVTRVLARLVQHIRSRSGECASSGELVLSCPGQARYLGTELAIVAESVRRASVLRPALLCASTFITMPAFARLRNTPGAMLESEDCWQVKAANQLRTLGIVSTTTLWFPMKTGPIAVFNANFLELLFGFALQRPCEAEVERVCAVQLGNATFDIDTLSAQVAQRQRALAVASGASPGDDGRRFRTAAARELLERIRPPRIAAFHMTNREGDRLKRSARLGPLLECELHAASLRTLEKAYARARKLIPLSLPFARADSRVAPVRPRAQLPALAHPPALNLAAYVRTGPGSKLVPDVAFLPLLDTIARACDGGGRGVRALHVHVFTDYMSDKCCGAIERWAAAANLSVTVNVDAYRLLQYHALWSADVLVTSWSKMPRGIGLLSPRIRLVADGSRDHPSSAGAAHATIFSWAPCPFPPHDGKPDCTSAPPTVGLDQRNGSAHTERLRRMVADLCAAKTVPARAAAAK